MRQAGQHHRTHRNLPSRHTPCASACFGFEVRSMRGETREAFLKTRRMPSSA